MSTRENIRLIARAPLLFPLSRNLTTLFSSVQIQNSPAQNIIILQFFKPDTTLFATLSFNPFLAIGDSCRLLQLRPKSGQNVCPDLNHSDSVLEIFFDFLKKKVGRRQQKHEK